MNINQLTILCLSLFVFSCTPNSQPTAKKDKTPSFQNKGHELVYKMVQKVGNYNALLAKKDVVYTYTYQTPDGKADISIEKYIFNGELSLGEYQKHERTFPDLEGTITQGYDGREYWLKHGDEVLNEEARLKRVVFSRPTNFYWFAMFPKLLDPSVVFEFIGEHTIGRDSYDIVKCAFKSSGDKPTDIYQLYINRKTSLVDQFLFTVADFGVIDEPLLMKVKYKEIDGLMIPSQRQYKKSTWDAAVSDDPWIDVNWTNIKFNNGLTAAEFKK